MVTIRDKVLKKSNDYSDIERSFFNVTRQDLTTGKGQKQKIFKIKSSVSIVIPAYMGKNLPLVLKSLEKQSFKNFEVVIVDDCSPIPIREITSGSNFFYPIKIIRNSINRGRPMARNIGISMSRGDVIITLDQDMMVHPDFVFNFVLRQEVTNKCVFLGLRENIDNEKYDKHKKADFKKDWRYRQKSSEKFILLSPVKKRVKIKNRTYHLLKETDNFKNFGNGKCVGYWDLSSMVISHSLCFKKKDVINAGGFPEDIFKGWGVEDLALGASFIAHGKYIVPLLNCTSYHINHERLSGSREVEWSEFLNNLTVYFNFVNTPMNQIKFNNHKAKKILSIKNISLYRYE